MEAIGMYLLKSTIWLTGFGLIFLLFLRNERYFLLNRIYLLMGIGAAIIFPFINWYYSVEIPVFPGQYSNEIQTEVQVVSRPIPFFHLGLLISYLIGSFYLFYRLFRQTSKVLEVIRKSGKQIHNSIQLIRTSDFPVSFSFFHIVFINSSINDTESQEILNHEQEHVRQKHWMDLVLFELLLLLQWFNPMIWLYGSFIRQNHEYLADERALQYSANPAIYRAALLNQMLGGPVIALGNSFNYALNTKRFNMMKNKFYSPVRKLKLLLVLPLVALVFYSFSSPEYVYVEKVRSSAAEINSNYLPNSGDTIQVTSNSSGQKIDTKSAHPFVVIRDDSSDSAKAKAGERKITWHQPDWSSGDEPAKKEGVRIGGSGVQPLYVIDGVIRKNQNINDISPESIESINVLKDKYATKKYGRKGKNGVIEITTKVSKSTGYTTQKEPVVVIGYPSNSKLITKNYSSGNEPITVIGYRSQFFNVQPDSTVHPHNKLLFGGNGNVVTDTPRDGKQIKEGEMMIHGVGKQPLILIDGVVAENQHIDAISPENIESITVLKDQSANILYGEKGKNGVILFTLKNEKSGNTIKSSGVSRISVANASDRNTDTANEKIEIEQKIFSSQASEHKPLIVKDGVIAEDQNIKEFGTREALDKITILNGKEAIDKYGEKGKYGVIEMTTKK